MSHRQSDIVVVGAGAAGLYTALCGAREGATVTLISPHPLAQSASYWAQGGLAAALARDDTIELHFADTIRAGRGLVRPSAAQTLCEEAPDRVKDLEALGVEFDRDPNGDLSLGLEGGHSARRVTHAGGSATGRQIVRQLSAVVREQPEIEVLEQHLVESLLLDGDGRCAGVLLANGDQICAPSTVLTTGGAAALWSRTTNPPGSVGFGMMLARDAGASLADLELLQFHPTAVIGVPGIEGFLITEAIRGEGATLHDASGERFIDELMPRDEVSVAIYRKLRETGAASVGLDMRAIDLERFPNVVSSLREAGIEPSTDLIPVAPATHYTMGGIKADLYGRTDVSGLFAVGECACIGLHGANRLASNSLSECFVFGRRAAIASADLAAVDTTKLSRASDTPPPFPDYSTRTAMWERVGIERSPDLLEAALEEDHPLAQLVARSALERTESRGAHVRTDHPTLNRSFDLRHVVIGADGSAALERWT